MNWKRLLLGIGVVVALSAAGYWAYRQFLAPAADEATATAVDVNTISVDTGVEQVSAEGQVVPIASVHLAFQASGQLAAILVAEGEQVQAGDPLLRLDSTDQDIALAQAQAVVAQAQANVAAAQAGQRAAAAGLKAARVGVSAAEAQLGLLQAGPSPAQLAASAAGVSVAEAGVTQAAGNRDATLTAVNAAQIQGAEARVAAAQAQYDAARRSFEPVLQRSDADALARELAQLQLNAARLNLESAQAALADLRGGAPAGTQQAANAAVAAAQRQRDAAAADLALLQAGTRAEQLAIAQTGVTIAQNAVAEAELRLNQAETAVTQAEAARDEAETAVTAAQNALARRTLSAPMAGVVADISVKVGEVVTPGVPVAALADLSGWQVETTDLTELDVVAIAQGFPVTIAVDAFSGETFTGQVVDIATVADEVRGDVTYQVTIALDEAPSTPLRWGMTAFVTVETKP